MNLNRSSTESRLGATCSSTIPPAASPGRRVSGAGDVSMLTQNLTRILSRKSTHSLHTHTLTHSSSLVLCCKGIRSSSSSTLPSLSPSSPSSPSLLSTPLLVTETLRTDLQLHALIQPGATGRLRQCNSTTVC
ncbi:unnamed protein product [Pleuronectes platessa]|uniref:Uncharacterized protein n=1 Tax=Pleuronectes platessa TaxID=8262 RepID=A0A9N7YWR9_PLEPL|nr:unnamed protein product [Pleuronectes platessa]